MLLVNDTRFCAPQGWAGGVRREGGPGGLHFELDELLNQWPTEEPGVLHVLEVMIKYVHGPCRATDSGPEESAGWFQQWQEEASNGSQAQEGVKQVQKGLLHLYIGEITLMSI